MKGRKMVTESIKWMLTDPVNFFKNYDKDVYYRKHISKKNFPLQLPTADLLDVFDGSFNVEIDKYTFLENTSTALDLCILKELARKIPDCNYFEIGALRGESLFNVAQVSKHATALTLSKAQMKEFGFNQTLIESSNIFNSDIKNLTLIEANSLTYDFSKLGKFDMIFVDGDHSYNGVRTDSANVFNHLLHENSIIVWHDYTYFAESTRHEVLAGILDGIPSSHHKNLYHVSNSMCAIYSPKPLKSTVLKFPVYPNKTFKVKVEASRFGN